MHAPYRYIQMCYPNHLFHLYFEFVIIYLYIQRKRDADDHVSEQIAQINFQLFLTSSLTYAECGAIGYFGIAKSRHECFV